MLKVLCVVFRIGRTVLQQAEVVRTVDECGLLLLHGHNQLADYPATFQGVWEERKGVYA